MYPPTPFYHQEARSRDLFNSHLPSGLFLNVAAITFYLGTLKCFKYSKKTGRFILESGLQLGFYITTFLSFLPHPHPSFKVFLLLFGEGNI